MGEFDRNIRLRRYRDTLYDLGRYVTPARPLRMVASVTTTRLEAAILHRQRACRLIERGLLHHPYRLDSHEWTREKCVLRSLEPTVKWLPLHLQALIDTTRRVAIAQGSSQGLWHRLKGSSFQAWANDLIEALQDYRSACEALHNR